MSASGERPTPMTPAASAAVYRQSWDAKAYLRQYYTTPTLAGDDWISLPFLAEWLRGRPPVGRALEVGCGPVPYRAALFGAAGEIHLADYLPANLDEVRLWLDDLPGQHNWDVFLGEALSIISPLGGSEVQSFKRRLRSQITRLVPCDLWQPLPLGAPAAYELVTSFYCAEAVTSSVSDWERIVANLAGLVAPGGRLFVAAVRNADHYRVFEATFPAARVSETDWARLLPALGFDPARTRIDVATVPDWVDEGFDSICVIRAEKRGPT